MRLSPFQLTLCLMLLSGPAYAQQKADGIVLDFAAQTIRGLPAHSGRAHSLSIVNFNPLCFSPSVRVDFQRATFDTQAAQALFRTSTQPEPGTAPAVDIPEAGGAGTPPADTGNVAFTNMTVPQLIAVNPILLLERAEAELKELDTYRHTAERIVSMLENMNCATSWNVSTVLSEWRKSREHLISSLANTDAKLGTIRRYLDAASGQPEGQREPLASLIRDFRASANRMETVLQPLNARLTVAAPRLDAASDQSTILHEFDADHDVEGATVTVSGDAAGDVPDVVRTFQIPMRRRHRIAFSTGVVATSASSVRFDRVNRIAENDDGVTAVISTFDETSGGDWDLINPALFVSGSFFSGGGANLFGSLGTTLRNVNNQTSLEPLVGLGLGLIDRLFLQAGLHFGRRERLLITTQEGVAVPTEVTRSDAVGSRWDLYVYSGFSIRVN